ncbi:MAG: amino acid racemase [Deltaproteobacteria bacterium]|nr:amino acid racemase [Deltaproteobacteria bacterium]
MKTIGILGSVTWQATIEYYRIINEIVANKLGGHHCAKIVMTCTDFENLVQLAKTNKWDEMASMLTKEVQKLEKSGADFFLICSNSIHKIAEKITTQVSIPILHIVEVTAQKIQELKIQKTALFGTNFTMEDGFYHKIMDKYGIEIMVPDKPDRHFIHNSIFEELAYGKFQESTKKEYIRIIQSQVDKGAEGLILGCTEIPLLMRQVDVHIPIFDTTQIHAVAAAHMALA